MKFVINFTVMKGMKRLLLLLFFQSIIVFAVYRGRSGTLKLLSTKIISHSDKKNNNNLNGKLFDNFIFR